MTQSQKPVVRISSAWRRFLGVYACFAVFTYFSGTFINTYLIKATGGSEGVMIFNILLAAVQPFAMLLAVVLIHKRTPLVSQRVGLWMYFSAFAALGILGEGAVAYIQIIAIVISAANGFFFTTYALQLLAYATDSNRDKSYGLQSAIGGVIGIAIPSLSGLLLAGFQDFTGYRILFATGVVITIVSIYLTHSLAPVTNVTPKAELKKAFHVMMRNRAVLMAMLCSAANGFYAGTMSFFLNILMFSMSGNEAIIGFATTAASVAAILASMVYARVIRPDNRGKAILVSVGIVMLATIALLIDTSVPTLFAFNILLSATSVFFLNPPVTAYLGVIERTKDLEGLGGEVHALREFWYGGGRVLGVLVTMACSGLQNGAAIVILIILAVQAIPAFLLKAMSSVQDL